MTDSLEVWTSHRDVSDVVHELAPFVDDTSLRLAASRRIPDGDWVRFSVHLLDGSKVFEGVGRCQESTQEGASTYRVRLSLLSFDERNEIMWERLLLAREAGAHTTGNFDVGSLREKILKPPPSTKSVLPPPPPRPGSARPSSVRPPPLPPPRAGARLPAPAPLPRPSSFPPPAARLSSLPPPPGRPLAPVPRPSSFPPAAGRPSSFPPPLRALPEPAKPAAPMPRLEARPRPAVAKPEAPIPPAPRPAPEIRVDAPPRGEHAPAPPPLAPIKRDVPRRGESAARPLAPVAHDAPPRGESAPRPAAAGARAAASELERTPTQVTGRAERDEVTSTEIAAPGASPARGVTGPAALAPTAERTTPGLPAPESARYDDTAFATQLTEATHRGLRLEVPARLVEQARALAPNLPAGLLRVVPTRVTSEEAVLRAALSLGLASLAALADSDDD
ncbi:MAG: hypothetical protein KF729_16065 [Sandaracinaceae bacterium]|nr:hypothetical protein [Sandaracinaceae bacterium]